jgi:hypothetical protein
MLKAVFRHIAYRIYCSMRQDAALLDIRPFTSGFTTRRLSSLITAWRTSRKTLGFVEQCADLPR